MALIFGAGSFNAENAATRWGAFYAPKSRHALALQSERGRVQRARKGVITASGLAAPPTKTALDASASAFGYKAWKLHRTIFNEVLLYRRLEIYARACEVSRGDPRRRAFLGAAEGKASLRFLTGTPMLHCRFTA